MKPADLSLSKIVRLYEITSKVASIAWISINLTMRNHLPTRNRESQLTNCKIRIRYGTAVVHTYGLGIGRHRRN
jgi:hypothetical protein